MLQDLAGSLTVLRWSLPLGQVYLIAYQKRNSLGTLILVVQFKPPEGTFEGGDIGDIIEYECAAAILEVAGNEALEPLLARRVPKLQPIVSFLVGDVFDQEVDSDGGLICGIDTL